MSRVSSIRFALAAASVHGNRLRSIPTPIVVLLAMNFALILIPVVDFWAGSPVRELGKLINLDAETTLQAWYSSMQWFCAGCLFGLVALHAYRSRLRGLVAVAAFAVACIVFSIDEIAGIHEWLGHKSDALVLPDGDRRQTVLSHTGVWPFLVGVPVVAALALIVRRLRHISLLSPLASRLLVTGLVIMFIGALAIELSANLIEKNDDSRGLYLAQLVVEEFLEMLGVTLIVWAAYELLHAQGFALRFPGADGTPTIATANRGRLPNEPPEVPE